MSSPQFSLENISGVTKFEQRLDGWWMSAPALDVLSVASSMLARGARLITMTGMAREDGETDLIYHYFLDGQAYHFRTQTHQQSEPSVAVLLPAANWIEREIQDLFAVHFEGHPSPERLVRPPQLEAGFFRRPGGAATKE
jgi:NADH-quinone oxidoreductase subunit C